MSTISSVNHRDLFSKALIASFNDQRENVFGFAKLFPKVTSKTTLLSIEVMRNNELIAVDVKRCTDPVMNTFSTFKENVYLPPYFKEAFAINQCDAYNDVFNAVGEPNLKSSAATRLFKDNAAKIAKLKAKIERAIELQRAQVLTSGIVKLENGDSIDYGRKSESMKVLTSTAQWNNTATADPLKDLKDAAAFLRTQGKSQGNTLNVVMAPGAIDNFLANEKVLAQAESRRINRVDINNPKYDNETGMSFHGQISTSDFVLNLYTYNNTYDAIVDGVKATKSYLEDNMVIVLPNDFEAKTGFGALPVMFKNAATGAEFVLNKETDFYVRDYVDQVYLNWLHEISAAPLAIPVTIDKIYTIKTVS